ncbi:sugar ABC transporter substrate-binding protein [Actinoplanes sp. M2I2]|uniref:sugar ABC transporter substrate-binding protein n=1 Tax=Actinoplanes sp. M2I2 TaxID=1734444 RepID=UPI00202243E2|nr:sugar ABC transporter substrate-binding protein [Actinoplanes sp. M2I2]
MFWTRALALTGAATLVLAAAGCGDDGNSGGESGGTTTLTFVNAQDPGTFDKVIAAFEKANPTIKIKQQVVPFDDLNSTVQSRLGAKDSDIDLYDVDEPRLAAFASRGFLEPLDDLRGQAEGQIDPNALKITTFDGKQYAMPRWTSTQLLYYNKDLLTKARVTAPAADPKTSVTWEQVTADGKKAQEAGAKYGLIFDQVDRYYQLQPLAESLGGGPGLTGDGLLQPDVTNAGWTRAFTWYHDIFQSGVAPRGINPEQTPGLFATGGTAFFAGGPWNAAAFDKEGADYGVAPFPKFAQGKPATSTDSWSTGISPFSDSKDAARKFLSYMTIDPAGATATTSNNIPVQKEAFQTYLKNLGAKGERYQQIADIIEYSVATTAVSRPITTGFVDFESVMNKAFADIRNGTDATTRLTQAGQELDRDLAKYRNK